MKLIFRIFFIGVMSYFLSPFFPWWIAMLSSFVVCFYSYSSSLDAFISGLLGVGLVWMGRAWSLDVQNESVFSSKIAAIMNVGEPIYLVLGAGIVGGLAGGLAAITGTTLRHLFIKPKPRSLYN